MNEVLRVESVSKRFGGITALNNFSMCVNQVDVVGLIGPNGSGKTTLLNTINGFHRPDEGQIFLNRERIDRLSSDEVARRKVGRTFQTPRLFRRMSVLENLLVPAHTLHETWSVDCADFALDLLNSLGLRHKASESATNLSGGEQKLVEFARAIMLRPSILLLDEPFAGVHPVLKESMISYMEKKKSEGITVILASHDMPTTFRFCSRLVVLSTGRKIAEGTPDEVRDDPKVIEAYLGV